MAKTRDKKAADRGMFWEAAEKIHNMTPKEFRQMIVELGINNPDGSLTKKYRLPREAAPARR